MLRSSTALRLAFAFMLSVASIPFPISPATAATVPPLSPARSVAAADNLPPVVPPPHLKPAPTSISGRTDLPYDIEPGFIRLRVRPNIDIAGILAKYGIGPASYWNTPPFDASDHRAGLDRSFKVAVPRGAERTWTTRLAPVTTSFEYVQPVWKEQAQLALAPNDPMFVPNQSGYLNSINMQRAWDRTVSYTGVIIAIIDSGLRATHEDAGLWKQLTGYDAFTQTVVGSGYMTDTGCFGGHGSEVTSIAAGDTNNGKGVAATPLPLFVSPAAMLVTSDPCPPKQPVSVMYPEPTTV